MSSLTSDSANFENNCVKTNKGRSTMSAARPSMTLVSGDIRFMRIFAGFL